MTVTPHTPSATSSAHGENSCSRSRLLIVDLLETRNRQRFASLVTGLIAGRIEYSRFEPWEIAPIVDFSQCRVRKNARKSLLERYQHAVTRGFDEGVFRFPAISKFIAANR
jgi:hypothetical protein